MFSKITNEIIRELYAGMMKRESRNGKVSKETEKMVLDFLEEKKQTGSEDWRYAELRSELLMMVSGAEENGFAEGFRFAVRLLMECIEG